MWKALAIAAATTLLLGVGCKQGTTPVASTPRASAPTAQPAFAKDTTGRVIVHIVSRHETITVKSGDHGVLYTLVGADGKTILADASGAEFQKVNPQLYQQMQHYIAVQADTAEAIQAADIRGIPFSASSADNAAR